MLALKILVFGVVYFSGYLVLLPLCILRPAYLGAEAICHKMDRDSQNVTYKKESIPGHHMNVSEEESEWELVPGTVSDYRRKNSKDPNHLGPAEPHRNRNALDDYIDERNRIIREQIRNETVKAVSGLTSHRKESVVEFHLKVMSANSENNLTSEEKNRILIKVDPSIELFPSEWKYASKSKVRVIPLDYFYKVNASVRTSKPVILWTAMMNGNKLQGNISIPEFILDVNRQRHVLWQNTTFNLTYQTSAEDSLQYFTTGGALHNSRLILKDIKCSRVENISNDFETLNWQLDTFQKISLIQAGQSLPTSDVLLLGELTENKTAFLWDGSLMFKFANHKKADDLEVAMADVNSDWSAIPLKITAVSFKVDSINEKPSSMVYLWSSLTPGSFPLAVLANSHVTDVNSALFWAGHVEEDRLKGNFTLPIFSSANTSQHVLRGTFEMRLKANLPQFSWRSKKTAYTGPNVPPPPGPKSGPRPAKGPQKKPPPKMIILPYLDLWPPPPSNNPKTFPIPFPINITASPSDPVVQAEPSQNLDGSNDKKVDIHNPKDNGKSLPLLHWSSSKIFSQKDLSKLIKPSPASSHLILNTVPWPPVYPMWPSDKPPPPWEQPFPFADSNAEPHPDEPLLAKKMELEEKEANVHLNSKGTQTDWKNDISKPKKKRKKNMLRSSPVRTKQPLIDEVQKLTQLYMKKLATVIKPGIQYATKLLMKSKEGVNYGTAKLNVSDGVASLLKNSVPSKIIIDGGWKDNNVDYYWPGNAVFLVATPSPASMPFQILSDRIRIIPRTS